MRNYIFYGALFMLTCVFNVNLTASKTYEFAKVKNLYISDPIHQEIYESAVNKIVIDAGHGGRDGGTSGSSNHEKDITLKLALQVGASIQAQFPDLEIIYTRTTDVFVPLSERARIANEAHADLFISIHCNAMPASVAGRKIHGSETYVLGATKKEQNLLIAKRENETIFLEHNHGDYKISDSDSPEWHIFMSMYQQNYLERSVQFADMVEQKFVAYGKRKSRGVLQNNFHVLREVAMPSVLIETGYLSNFSDENYLSSQAGQDKIVRAITDAFYEYKMGLDTNQPVYVNTNPTHLAKKENAFESSYQTKEIPKPIIKRKNLNKPTIKKEQKVAPKPTIKRRQRSEEEVVASTTNHIYAKVKPVTAVYESKIIANTTHEPEIEKPVNKRKKRQIVDLNKLSLTPVFKVQFAASKAPLDVKTEKFKQLSNIEVVYEAGYFKYLTGHTKHWSDITSLFKVLKNKGFNGFIVAYLNDQRIGLQEARDMTK